MEPRTKQQPRKLKKEPSFYAGSDRSMQSTAVTAHGNLPTNAGVTISIFLPKNLAHE